MNEMFKFAKDIYPEVLHAYLDSGIVLNIDEFYIQIYILSLKSNSKRFILLFYHEL